jgi:hypothetical protein
MIAATIVNPAALRAITIMRATTAVNKNDVSSWSEQVESLSRSVTHWNIAYVILVFLTVIASALTLVATVVIVWKNTQLGHAQSNLATAKDRALATELRDKDEQIAWTNERSAKLEKEAADAKLELAVVSKIGALRQINGEIFSKYIKGVPKRRVELLYHENDPEASRLASQIRYNLGAGVKGSGAGWDVSEPKSVAFTGNNERLISDLDRLLYGNINGGLGLAIVCKAEPKPGTEDRVVWQALINALTSSIAAGFRPPALPTLIAPREDSSLPEDTFVIVVLQKQ